MAINRKVLDVSKYQPNIDYAACAKEIDGVILRCGLTYWGQQNKAADPYFEAHYKGFKAAGVPVGVYYYSAADNVTQAQLEAAKCLEIIKGKQFEYPVYFDMENKERQGKLTGTERYAIADAFLSKVQGAGYYVGFYSYSAFIQQMGTEYFNRLKLKYSVWLADYRKTPASYTRDMWQYTSSGAVAGIKPKAPAKPGLSVSVLIKTGVFYGHSFLKDPSEKKVSDAESRRTQNNHKQSNRRLRGPAAGLPGIDLRQLFIRNDLPQL